MVRGAAGEVHNDTQKSQRHEQLQTYPLNFTAPAKNSNKQKSKNGSDPNNRNVREHQMNMGPIHHYVDSRMHLETSANFQTACKYPSKIHIPVHFLRPANGFVFVTN